MDTDFKVLFLDTATWTLMDSYQIRKRYSRPPLPVTRLQQQHVSSNASFSLSISSLIINAHQLTVFSNYHVIFFATFFSSSLHLSSLEDDGHTFGGCRANMVESNRTCSIPILFKLERALSLKSLYLKKNSKNTSLNLQTERNQIFNLTIR